MSEKRKPLFDGEKFGMRICKRMTDDNLSYRDIAELVGISPSTMYRASIGKNPDVESYLRISAFLRKK